MLLEKKILSAADLLDATERMDRIIKRSFRLNRQLEEMEKEKPEATSPQTRRDLVRKLYG